MAKHPTLVKFATPASTTRCSPIVARLYDEIRKAKMTYDVLEQRSGVGQSTIRSWRSCRRPSVDNLEACYNVLGFTLDIRRLDAPHIASDTPGASD